MPEPLIVGPGDFQALPAVPAQRRCSCGQPTRWSHLQYLGRGRSAPVYLCAGCGLVYRGNEREGGNSPVPVKSRRPVPEQGPPENPVLGQELAERLRQLLADP
ncbi:MAG: hypothetical protein ACRENX_00130 [Candidatus Dormibacteria bacterium]